MSWGEKGPGERKVWMGVLSKFFSRRRDVRASGAVESSACCTKEKRLPVLGGCQRRWKQKQSGPLTVGCISLNPLLVDVACAAVCNGRLRRLGVNSISSRVVYTSTKSRRLRRRTWSAVSERHQEESRRPRSLAMTTLIISSPPSIDRMPVIQPVFL